MAAHVLIDFWATWCPPCVAGIPKIKAAYEKLNFQGFEVIGVSLDEDKSALEKFITENQVPWPQHFDGSVWGNRFAKEFGIRRVPTMWLVDKKGNLRHMEIPGDHALRVEELLAE